MTRRRALAAVAAVTAHATQGFATPVKPGLLRLDLDQYTGIVVEWRKQQYVIAPDELWQALKDD